MSTQIRQVWPDSFYRSDSRHKASVVRRGVLQYAPTFAHSHKGIIGLWACATTNRRARGKRWAGGKKNLSHFLFSKANKPRLTQLVMTHACPVLPENNKRDVVRHQQSRNPERRYPVGWPHICCGAKDCSQYNSCN